MHHKAFLPLVLTTFVSVLSLGCGDDAGPAEPSDSSVTRDSTVTRDGSVIPDGSLPPDGSRPDATAMGCGDTMCSGDEDCTSCAADCGQCPNIDTCGNSACDPNEHCGTCEEDCNACASPAPTLARVPYLQMVSDTQITIKWRTESDTDSVVAYGKEQGKLFGRVTVNGSTRRHEVKLTGLDPNSKYYYAYGSSDGALHGGDAEHYFRTSPTVGTKKTTRIWIIGDSGTGNDDQLEVYNQYRTHTGSRGTDIWLMLGDNAYGDGTDSEYQDAVFDAYPEMLRNTPLFATLGNHDDCLDRTSEGNCTDLPESLDNVAPYYDIFTLPENGESGGLKSNTEAYYSFDFGDVHFVCLNSQTHENSTEMQAWLEADLQASTASWIIAFWHHPPYTNGSHNSDREGSLGDMRTNFVGILEDHGVDLVFTGHSHSYERTALLNGYYGESDTFDAETHVVALNGDGTISDGDPNGDGAYSKSGAEGAVYSVVGSSGKTSSSDYPNDYWTCKDGFKASCDNGPMLPGMVVYLEHLGSAVVDVDPNAGTADVIFLDATDGKISDRYRIVK